MSCFFPDWGMKYSGGLIHNEFLKAEKTRGFKGEDRNNGPPVSFWHKDNF